MVNIHSPASFTKNFGWDDDYSPLYNCIRSGFQHRVTSVKVTVWRAYCGLPDRDRELIPLRFFLFSQRRTDEDYLLPDELVFRSIHGRYASDFDRLALFAFHLARSGGWKGSKWTSGQVAQWAREYICDHAWSEGAWQQEAFSDEALESYIYSAIKGREGTRRKMVTNYRHMLRIAGLAGAGVTSGPLQFSAGAWAVPACKLLWDRSIYSGELAPGASESGLVDFFRRIGGFKLLGTSTEQGLVIASRAAAEYFRAGGIHRFG